MCATIHFDAILLVHKCDGDVEGSSRKVRAVVWDEDSVLVTEADIIKCEKLSAATHRRRDVFATAHGKEESSEDEISSMLVTGRRGWSGEQ